MYIPFEHICVCVCQCRNNFYICKNIILACSGILHNLKERKRVLACACTLLNMHLYSKN